MEVYLESWRNSQLLLDCRPRVIPVRLYYIATIPNNANRNTIALR